MALDTKPGEGLLFRNEKKEPGSRAPDFNGQGCCPFCSRQFEMSGWSNESKKTGKKFIAFKYAEPYAGRGQQDDGFGMNDSKQKTPAPPIDDDIPF